MRPVKDPLLANLRGAAFVAGVGLGALRFDQVPARVPIARTYTPDTEHRKLYDALYREYLELYRRMKPIYARHRHTTVRDVTPCPAQRG